MELFWNAGRLTDLGALLLAVVVTVAIFRVVIDRAYRTEPARLGWPTTARREARRLADAADLAAANEAGH
jgi:hypothetical protein